MKAKQKCIERDYTAGLKDLDCEVTPADKELMKNFLKCLKYKDDLLYVVDPFAAKCFEKMVNACDLIAKEFSGKLKATVDYEYHSAKIELKCLYVDFDRGEFMETLQQLAAVAQNIRFQPLTSGLLQIEVIMPYFLTAKKHNAL